MITRTDIIVVVVCLLAGYFLVSWLIGRIQGGSARQAEPPPAPPPPGSGGGHGDHRRPGPQPPTGNTAKPWYEVLQVPTYASLDDVKQAYRRRIAEYHPDKTSGLGDDLRALAEQKSKEINAAYAAALKAFGKQ